MGTTLGRFVFFRQMLPLRTRLFLCRAQQGSDSLGAAPQRPQMLQCCTSAHFIAIPCCCSLCCPSTACDRQQGNDRARLGADPARGMLARPSSAPPGHQGFTAPSLLTPLSPLPKPMPQPGHKKGGLGFTAARHHHHCSTR